MRSGRLTNRTKTSNFLSFRFVVSKAPFRRTFFLYPVKPSGQSMRIKKVVQRSGLTKIVPDSLISGAARYFPSGGHPVNWGTGASRSLL